MEIREITAAEDKRLAEIIRYNFIKHKLDIPGTVFFDPELDHLSEYYLAKPNARKYFVLWDEDEIRGGIGFAEFEGFENCAELQKLYLTDEVKGKGYGKLLLSHAEKAAKECGYEKAYIETHSNLEVAIQMYHRYGYTLIDRPDNVSHGAMDNFFLKNL